MEEDALRCFGFPVTATIGMLSVAILAGVGPGTQSPSAAESQPSSISRNCEALAQTEVLRDTRAQGLQAYRHLQGEMLRMEVTGSTLWPIWGGGDGVYSDDSPVGVAAVHAGLIAPGEKGVVAIEILPGRSADTTYPATGEPTFIGSSRNGVDSRSGHPNGWDGAYRFVPECS